MATEIERKFVLEGSPPVPLGPGTHLRQGYLAEEGGVSVRVRIAGERAWLTVKTGAGLARVEVELPLARVDADVLWPATAGRRLEKTRHGVDVADGVRADVDVYEGPLTGLVTAEVEFGSIDCATAFEPPAWFGREVTGDAGWTNAALARRGRPDRQSSSPCSRT